MSSTVGIAMVLRPLVYFVLFFAVIAPIIWLLNRIIPQGRLKFFLFKVRDGKESTRKDKATMWIAVIAAYALLFAFIAFMISRGESLH